MRSVARQFADIVTAAPEGGLVMGTVVAVNADATLDVDVRGTTLEGLRYLSHVAPRPGFGVWLERVDSDLLAVGVPAQLGWPSCRVRRDANGAAYASGTQVVSFDTAVHDPWDMWTSGTNVVIPIPGLYDFSAGLNWDANNTGHRSCGISVAGAYAAYQRTPATAADAAFVTAAATGYPCAAGDIVTLEAAHTSGTNRTLLGGAAHRQFLSVTYRGPIGT
jgi:hypothetical protein